jgi:ectoine hydroxylase-related dioxygenase (phytanoyl-CoA dioxygenase family)
MIKLESNLSPIIAHIIDRYNHQITHKIQSRFLDLDTSRHQIVRAPHIGDGKTNVHFAPFTSRVFQIVSQISEKSGINSLIRSYLGESSSLCEVGFSVTRPGGEGIEWHSDGSEGECTVLMSLLDIPEEMGMLGMVPRSHTNYTSAYDKEEEEKDDEDSVGVWHSYKSSGAVVLDARTRHRALNNNSTQYRVLIWLIYNTRE